MKRDMKATGVYRSNSYSQKTTTIIVSMEEGEELPEHIELPGADFYYLDEDASDLLRINLIRRTEENS